MANHQLKVPESIEGEFFVDQTCIDCDTCRQIAPEVFGETGEFSYVYHQPASETEVRLATQALLSCPTGSIGTLHANQAKEVMQDFPLPVPDQQFPAQVYYCGFNSPKSYGGNSYLIRHPEGNWLIDSPKFLPYLTQKLESWGGLRYIFLTHQDDVADAASYAQHFGSERIIHQAEIKAQPDAERVIEGTTAIEIAPGFKIVPTPGHTRGHCVLLYQNHFLFTGDHLWWNPESAQLGASERYCWHSWQKQSQSMEVLLHESFAWVLPGHGQRVHLAPEQMHQNLRALINRMQATASR